MSRKNIYFFYYRFYPQASVQYKNHSSSYSNINQPYPRNSDNYRLQYNTYLYIRL